MANERAYALKETDDQGAESLISSAVVSPHHQVTVTNNKSTLNIEVGMRVRKSDDSKHELTLDPRVVELKPTLQEQRSPQITARLVTKEDVDSKDEAAYKTHDQR